MNGIRCFSAAYEECKEELLAFRNANRDEKRDIQYFDWRYLGRPNKAKPIIVWAESEKSDRIGALSVIPHHFSVDNASYCFGVLGDISISKLWRGKGIAKQMFKYLSELEEIKHLGICLVLPNEQASHPLESANWKTVSKLQRYVQVIDATKIISEKKRRTFYSTPIACIVNFFLKMHSLNISLRGADRYRGVLVEEFDERFDELWEKVKQHHIIIGFRTKEYLTWRYLKHPSKYHHIFTLIENAKLIGYVVFHIEDNKCFIDDLLFNFKGVSLSLLLSHCIQYLRSNCIASSISISINNSEQFKFCAWMFGFFRRNDYQSCMINITREELAKELLQLSKVWFLTAGDKDV
jgi:hypothetical protein